MIWAASIMILALSIPDILLQWPKADLAASTAWSTSTAPQGSNWHKTRPAGWNVWTEDHFYVARPSHFAFFVYLVVP